MNRFSMYTGGSKTKKKTSVFVSDRITEIIKETDASFRYINMKQNPADIPTRGMPAEELKLTNLVV